MAKSTICTAQGVIHHLEIFKQSKLFFFWQNKSLKPLRMSIRNERGREQCYLKIYLTNFVQIYNRFSDDKEVLSDLSTFNFGR